jgi:riboflavin kinase/FMN adenylyltransferase
MIVARGIETPPPPATQGSVVSIGVFDGVHLGHRAILARNLERARELGARATVITFAEHPKSLLLGRAPRTVTSLEHRLELFARAHIECVWVLHFDAALRALDARAFVEQLCLRNLEARRFVLGFDSKFGRDRAGTPEALAAAGHPVDIVPQVLVAARAVSSTAIRECIELGDLEAAARLLGRRVSTLGTVVAGDQLGRRLGFPTANLDLHHELHPPVGVYAARARLPGASSGQPAVVNIGWRPTVSGETPRTPRVEVHLLDWSGDLYGQALEVEYVARLRDERRFNGLGELTEQIARDVQSARAHLAAG